MYISKHNQSRITFGESPRARLFCTIGFASIVLAGCGTNSDGTSTVSSIGAAGHTATATSTPSTSTGGTKNSLGGALNTGGSSSASSPSTGGASSSSFSTGGVTTGGSVTSSNVGGSNSGGTSSVGGAQQTGGTRTSTAATGGKWTLGTGGSSAGTGGSSVGFTGGAKGSGGASSTGGSKAATGGVVATGGSSSTSSCTPSSTKFSFFITSQARLFALAQAFNGSTKGFGGDLRYGESTGLAGADKICTAIAQVSMPNNCKTWRAFLSAADGGSGTQVNAISRIGNGPWYDRVARLVANSTSELLNTRPTAANSTIINDLPNEDGVPNHDALQTGNTTNQDNHDILTGTGTNGNLYNASSTCSNWTSSTGSSSQKPRCGHSWPAAMGGGGMMASWMSALDEAGCAPGYNLAETVNGMPSIPGSDGTMTVGSGGGYGAIYCFALNP